MKTQLRGVGCILSAAAIPCIISWAGNRLTDYPPHAMVELWPALAAFAGVALCLTACAMLYHGGYSRP
ncbi:MAG: hypothetical protein ABFE13_11555 [Phycisphaerales bacterium]